MLALLTILLAASPDTEPPRIEHTPVERAPRGANISIEATIKDPSGVFYPLVFVRQLGSRSFASYPMEDRGGDKYVSELPASILSRAAFEYFLAPADGVVS